ncbi:MAG: EFR1 family ferrodoxin [bacterium]|nr:EFR1 family ferrodoxin [bacterium]
MIGIYFSGTGNTGYAVEHFVKTYDADASAYSIEDSNITEYIADANQIVFGYPVQYSNIPKFVKDFVDQNKRLWKGKMIFVIATMGLFSGDGAGILARRLKKHDATIIGGLHLKMTDSIADEKALKRPFEENQKLIMLATQKIERAAEDTRNGHAPQDGIGFLAHLAGLFGQRLYFYNKTRHYSDKLKIDPKRCVGCGRCESICPTKNICIENKVAVAKDRCTMCYRCVNTCPKQAITLLGKRVVEQGTIDKYL